MFTGIITEVGKVVEIKRSSGKLEYSVQCQKLVGQLKIDSSVAIDGVCQSVTKIDKDKISFQAIPVTVEKTNLKNFRVGRLVNMEESLTLQKPIDGHLVYGHVSATGRLIRKSKTSAGLILEISHSSEYSQYIINEGSIAINGVSLTVSKKINSSTFQVCVIPLTYSLTNFKNLNVSDEINLEFDVILRANLQLNNDSKLMGVLQKSGYL